MDDDLPLSALLSRSLASAEKAYSLPTIDDTAQDLIQASLRDLQAVHARVVALALFSPNETLDDIATPNLPYLFVPYLLADAHSRIRATTRPQRMTVLSQAQVYINAFLDLLEKYEIVPEDEREMYSKCAANVADPSRRRELKIGQFKKERELKARVETLYKKRGQTPAEEDVISDYSFISSLLPTTPTTQQQQESGEEESQTEELLRETALLLLRLLHVQAQMQRESMIQELELLRNAPAEPVGAPSPEDDSVRSGRPRADEGDDMWRLDAPAPRGGPDGKGPLLDSLGKPLRPFTILPSDAGERARLQAQVFGSGHNLPTMSIDEYLMIEQERGNIITGGGAASQAAPTSSEQLQLDSEMDGTRFGDEKREEKRRKEESWARYTDENPRGTGNTMNRG